MRNIIISILFPFLTITSIYGQIEITTAQIDDFIEKSPDEISSSATIYKIVYDFNGDGLKDIALSNSDSWGNAGGSWYFYFNKNDSCFYYYDEIPEEYVMDPTLYAVKSKKGKPNTLLLYNRMGCCSGSFISLSVTQEGFSIMKVEEIGTDEEMPGEEIAALVEKKLLVGQKGIVETAQLQCLLSGEKDCWKDSL